MPRRLSTPFRRIADAAPWVTPPVVTLAERGQTVTGIVFSKDRPLQLEALLQSYEQHVAVMAPLTIIYHGSHVDFDDAYARLIDLHKSKPYEFVNERYYGGFETALNDRLVHCTSNALFFLVDDIIFTEDVDVHLLAELTEQGLIPSLRMGRNLSWSYTRQCPQPLPPMKPIRFADRVDQNLASSFEDLWGWTWRSGSLDWAYALSVDGHIFDTKEISGLVRSSRFAAPNSLENALQANLGEFGARWGVCYAKSRLVNVPMNRVQNEILNLHGAVHQDVLLKKWFDGERLDVNALAGFVNNSAHQEIPVPFRRAAS